MDALYKVKVHIKSDLSLLRDTIALDASFLQIRELCTHFMCFDTHPSSAEAANAIHTVIMNAPSFMRRTLFSFVSFVRDLIEESTEEAKSDQATSIPLQLSVLSISETKFDTIQIANSKSRLEGFASALTSMLRSR